SCVWLFYVTKSLCKELYNLIRKPNNPMDSGLCDRSWVRDFRGQYEPPLFWIIFVLGVVGNLMVVLIYCTVRNRIKTMTDVYLLNLAVADLLFLCTLPFWPRTRYESQTSLRRCLGFVRFVGASRVYLRDGEDTPKPHLLHSVYMNNAHNQTKILVLALQICMGFCLPLLFMIFCYSVIVRTLVQAKNFEKHKALRVIFAVVFVFVLSQLPYNSFLIMEATQATNMTITTVAKSLAYTHACLNPFLYVFIGVRFRQDLLKIVKMRAGSLSKVGLIKSPTSSKRSQPSIMSDTETTPALSL
uniref:Chemokine (C-C motif) receptor 9b n=1 Tax=Neogobius melanostomus TaxID=47308 RepID=A0A8C6UKF7_9GOBI